MFPAFYVPGLWLLDFTSQFAPDSPVRAPVFFICFVVPVKEREGQPEGYGTVTDMPHPSIHRRGTTESMFIWEECTTQTSADYDDGAAFTFKYT